MIIKNEHSVTYRAKVIIPLAACDTTKDKVSEKQHILIYIILVSRNIFALLIWKQRKE